MGESEWSSLSLEMTAVVLSVAEQVDPAGLSVCLPSVAFFFFFWLMAFCVCVNLLRVLLLLETKRIIALGKVFSSLPDLCVSQP